MGERVLPSRELTQAWLDAGLLRGHPNSTDEWTIVRAYAEGRLPDREDIERRIRKAMTLEVDKWADAIVNAVLFEGEAHREAG